jgi:hypothetical protein
MPTDLASERKREPKRVARLGFQEEAIAEAEGKERQSIGEVLGPQDGQQKEGRGWNFREWLKCSRQIEFEWGTFCHNKDGFCHPV